MQSTPNSAADARALMEDPLPSASGARPLEPAHPPLHAGIPRGQDCDWAHPGCLTHAGLGSDPAGPWSLSVGEQGGPSSRVPCAGGCGLTAAFTGRVGFCVVSEQMLPKKQVEQARPWGQDGNKTTPYFRTRF